MSLIQNTPFLLLILASFGLVCPTQEEEIFEPHLIDWQHSDALQGKVQGISSQAAYDSMSGREPEDIVVAVIDSGVDIAHEDLQGQIWINEDEVPDNGIDDDANGYVDDIYGWNFLGGAEGENVAYETKEITRIYRKYREQFENQQAANIPAEKQAEFALYNKAKQAYTKEWTQLEKDFDLVLKFGLLYEVSDMHMRQATGKDQFTLADVQAVESNKPKVMEAKAFIKSILQDGFDREQWHDYQQQVRQQVDYHYNLDYFPREIVGDDPDELQYTGYGNNDVYGTEPVHGTHVAGIIAAVRGNSIGPEGIARNVKIMCLRAVPNGDERDKDIGNAIHYAVDNGARIINLSFGKDLSPQESYVEAAIQHAEKQGVLIVHAAGNKSLNIDHNVFYPNRSLGSRAAANWIEVGASGRFCNKNLAASFSNYGRKQVDLFAPGVSIFGLAPNNGYDMHDGTSMAAPVVTGVAALVLSYFPSLSAEDLKAVLMESSIKHQRQRVYVPGSTQKKRKKTKFKKLSRQGGIVNAYTAVQLALQKAEK